MLISKALLPPTLQTRYPGGATEKIVRFISVQNDVSGHSFRTAIDGSAQEVQQEQLKGG